MSRPDSCHTALLQNAGFIAALQQNAGFHAALLQNAGFHVQSSHAAKPHCVIFCTDNKRIIKSGPENINTSPGRPLMY